MDGKAVDQLRMDQRLVNRRDWVSPEERRRALDELPDSTHKIQPPDSDEGDEAATPTPPDSTGTPD